MACTDTQRSRYRTTIAARESGTALVGGESCRILRRARETGLPMSVANVGSGRRCQRQRQQISAPITLASVPLRRTGIGNAEDQAEAALIVRSVRQRRRHTYEFARHIGCAFLGDQRADQVERVAAFGVDAAAERRIVSGHPGAQLAACAVTQPGVPSLSSIPGPWPPACCTRLPDSVLFWMTNEPLAVPSRYTPPPAEFGGIAHQRDAGGSTVEG